MPEEPQRFCLGIAYMPGRDPRIAKGQDGGRDFLTEAELEKAAWSYLRSGPKVNAFHVPGTEGCATVVESSIYRGPDWDLGDGIVVTKGTWLVGAILDDRMWQAALDGQVNGWSPEGTARRRRVRKEGAVPIAKGALADDDDGEEFSELLGADFPTCALVGKGANGIPRFLVMKQGDESAGLLEPGFVRDLIAKADPGPDRRERVVTQNGITVSGSPADIAAFIHKAAERGREREQFADAAGELRDAGLSAGNVAGVVKEKNDTADRKHKAETGAAMPNGSYPIASVGDLDKAIHAVGRGGSSHDAIRRHVISRARSLGASSKIPDNWNSDGSLKEGVSKEDAMTAAVAKDTALDDGIDGLDPTVPLAAPEDDAPGDENTPGTPAWEAIDAATARKWCSILSRARVAVDLLASREALEAASADPGDAENACDLQDVCCAIDYAISVLAPFAVAEQSEADCGEDVAAMVGKSAPDADTWSAISKAMTAERLGDDLFTIESLGAVVRKSGRVLSAVNESHLREAHARLNTVLSSLPQPVTDDGQPVAKMTPETEADMPEPSPSEAVTAASGQEPAMGAKEPPVAAQEAVVTKAEGEPRDAPEGDAAIVKTTAAVGVFGPGRQFLGLADPGAILTDIAKAGGEGKKAMCVVYNQDGALIGIVDPDDITPVSNSEAKPDEAPADEAAAPAPDAGDMTPQPPADAGTPAGDVAKAQDPAPATGAQEDQDMRTVLKSIVTEALGETLGAQGTAEGVAKQADVAALSGTLQDVLARLETVEKQDARPGVFANGATPPPGSVPPARPSLRGQDQGAQPVDVAKAADLKRQISSGAATAPEQNKAWNELMSMSLAKFAEIRGES